MKMKSLKSLKNVLDKKGQMLNDKQLSQVIGGCGLDCGDKGCCGWNGDECMGCCSGGGGGWAY